MLTGDDKDHFPNDLVFGENHSTECLAHLASTGWLKLNGLDNTLLKLLFYVTWFIPVVLLGDAKPHW